MCLYIKNGLNIELKRECVCVVAAPSQASTFFSYHFSFMLMLFSLRFFPGFIFCYYYYYYIITISAIQSNSCIAIAHHLSSYRLLCTHTCMACTNTLWTQAEACLMGKAHFHCWHTYIHYTKMYYIYVILLHVYVFVICIQYPIKSFDLTIDIIFIYSISFSFVSMFDASFHLHLFHPSSSTLSQSILSTQYINRISPSMYDKIMWKKNRKLRMHAISSNLYENRMTANVISSIHASRMKL